MSKKVFKGWCSRAVVAREIPSLSVIDDFVSRTKLSAALNWKGFEDHWPPRRVTVTVEVED